MYPEEFENIKFTFRDWFIFGDRNGYILRHFINKFASCSYVSLSADLSVGSRPCTSCYLLQSADQEKKIEIITRNSWSVIHTTSLPLHTVLSASRIYVSTTGSGSQSCVPPLHPTDVQSPLLSLGKYIICSILDYFNSSWNNTKP